MKKWVYLFTEGNANMRELLGGKGANLAEMTNIGLPVPQGFTITTEACTQYYEDGREINEEIQGQINEYITKMEEITGKKFGDHENPLLVSVRSGARASMPGMMDTILNLGLNETVVNVIAEKSGNPRWAWDCYRRFIQMYSDGVMEVGKKYFEQLIDKMKEEKGVKFQVGFNRRFDHNHKAVADAVKDGTIGDPHIVIVSSRDPEPPPASYVAVSGGIFYDMMIHDFDMARFLAGSEVTEVNAIGSVLVDPGIGEAGDVDTALVTLKFENGAIGVIDNSRKAVYGYDQRVEVFGSEGCAEDQNDTPNTAVLSTADGAVHGVAYKVMWDRYTGAFVAEMQAFADAVVNDKETPVTGEDGLYPVLMAAAATKSLHEGRPVKISEIE